MLINYPNFFVGHSVSFEFREEHKQTLGSVGRRLLLFLFCSSFLVLYLFLALFCRCFAGRHPLLCCFCFRLILVFVVLGGVCFWAMAVSNFFLNFYHSYVVIMQCNDGTKSDLFKTIHYKLIFPQRPPPSPKNIRTPKHESPWIFHYTLRESRRKVTENRHYTTREPKSAIHQVLRKSKVLKSFLWDWYVALGRVNAIPSFIFNLLPLIHRVCLSCFRLQQPGTMTHLCPSSYRRKYDFSALLTVWR